jgi:Protein of unknown function (DUF4232)
LSHRRAVRDALVAAAYVALLVPIVGCGTQSDSGADRGPQETPPSIEVDYTAPTHAADRPPGSPIPTEVLPSSTFRAQPASCSGTDRRIDAVHLDAATGHRYLAIQLVNCSDQAMRLDELPSISLRTASGRDIEPVVRAWEARPPAEVAPGGHAVLGLEYLAADQRPRATAITLTISGQEHVVSGELDLDARSRLTMYPWVTRTTELWAS